MASPRLQHGWIDDAVQDGFLGLFELLGERQLPAPRLAAEGRGVVLFWGMEGDEGPTCAQLYLCIYPAGVTVQEQRGYAVPDGDLDLLAQLRSAIDDWLVSEADARRRAREHDEGEADGEPSAPVGDGAARGDGSG